MINKGKTISFISNLFCIIVGCICYFCNFENYTAYCFFVTIVTLSLLFTVVYRYSKIVRPISYFILSFLIFVWMRIPLSLIFGTVVISTGNGITPLNIQKTTLFLGIAMCIMVCIALIVEEVMKNTTKIHFVRKKELQIDNRISYLVFGIAILFMILFVGDSFSKMKVIQSGDYLEISENILLEGYNYFKIGKYLLILWIIIGKGKNKILTASFVLLIASSGYLLRGARGYAICYFFLWLLIFAKSHKIKILNLLVIGCTLIFLANGIAEYRLGKNLTTGVSDTIITTLLAQGASIEPVFGSVNFKNEIEEIFPADELLSRDDFGLYVDKARGVNFVKGGFGTSFFAEVYFVGIFGFIFVLLMGLCVGAAEYIYIKSIECEEKSYYYDFIIFLTCTNLIYFARANISNYISRTIMAWVIVAIIIGLEQFIIRLPKRCRQ